MARNTITVSVIFPDRLFLHREEYIGITNDGILLVVGSIVVGFGANPARIDQFAISIGGWLIVGDFGGFGAGTWSIQKPSNYIVMERFLLILQTVVK